MWTYEQKTGHLIHPLGAIVAIGYAGGNCGHDPIGVNNPAMQDVQMVGPLPRGLYTSGKPFDSPRLGPYVIPLYPDHNNEMFGRSGFRIHGDTHALNHSGSEGCIVVARKIRELFATTEDNDLLVI